METVNIIIEMEDGGVMKGELYPEIAPISVENFLKLIDQDFFAGLIFHRVIPGFMIQGGGYDKDSAYDEWINAFDGKVKKLVLIGATREKIAQTAEKLGFHEIVMADTFEEAFEKCVEYAEPGDAVLLSPACASWGMFKNYEQRGDKFKELVNQL